MTNEMHQLYMRLLTVETDSPSLALDYVGEEVNHLAMDGYLDVSLTKEALKNIKKDIKTIQKIIKGKVDLDPQQLIAQYPEDSIEYFFLICVIRILKTSLFS
jgi:hypothetical protein